MGKNLDNNRERVDIIASGYEWICPTCNKLNKEIAWKDEVTCKKCRGFFGVNVPEHAYD